MPDRLCFRGILIRLVTGASWVDIEAILEHQVSDTTLRARRDEWIDAGVFGCIATTPPTVWAPVDRRVSLLVFDGAPTRRSVTRRLGTLVVLIGYARA